MTNNPLAWGNPAPEVLVLGFSKGPTQAGALANQPHDQIAFRGGRTSLAKILYHVGLLSAPDSRLVDQAITSRTGRFHFGSLIRCTVERFDKKEATWKGTGGGMLDKFVACDFGRVVLDNCSSRFLGNLPPETKLIVMLGLGTGGNYVAACRQALGRARPGRWRTINDVTYTDDKIVVVHTEHFASQGALLPDWLSGDRHERGRFGLLAREGVRLALAPADGGRSTSALATSATTSKADSPARSAQPAAPAITSYDVTRPDDGAPVFVFRKEEAQAFGRPAANGGYVVLKGSTAMREGSPKVKRHRRLRDELVRSGVLALDSNGRLYRFSADHEFSSPTAAAQIIQDGNASGPSKWKDERSGLSLKDYFDNKHY
jgi:hypothetical protein